MAKKGGAGALVAIFVGAGLAYAVGGGGGGSTGGSDASPAAQPVTGSQPWARMGWTLLERHVERGLNCVQASYGQVREYLGRTPCSSLDRELFALRDRAGNEFVVSVAWVHMATADGAAGLRTIDDRNGTGNVWPRTTTVLKTADVSFLGKYYASRRSSTTTTVSEAASASGSPGAATLKQAAELGATDVSEP